MVAKELKRAFQIKRISDGNDGKKRREWKGGRPAKIIKRKLVIGVRLTPDEHFIIKQKAGKAGISISRFLRETGLRGEVKERLSEEDRQIVLHIIGMSNNLNQLAKLAHQQGLLSVILLFENYRDKLDGLLNRVRHDQ